MAISTQTVDYSTYGLNAPELCSYLIAYELDDMYRQMPDQWVMQAQAGDVYFTINAEDIELGLVRVQLHSMKSKGNSVAGKFRISAVLNKKTGELCPWTDSPRGYQEFINFNSTAVTIPSKLFSKADYKLLQEYTAWWEAQTANMFTQPMCNRRLWIQPRNASFSLKFRLDVRLNPYTGTNLLGLSNQIVLKAPTFLDTAHCGVAEAPMVTGAQTERTGTRIVAAAKGITLPNR
jgi:hypothetical protein